MELTEIDDNGMGKGSLDGSLHEVDLSLIENPFKGDFVVVHAGFAIEKLDRDEADARLALFGELAELQREEMAKVGIQPDS
jgi:hydrogenase expression/formation protein HypC